jgi:hypothetical protein
MDIVFKTCKYDTCGLSITGLEEETNQYSEFNTENSYRYEDTVSLNVLIPVTKDDKDELPYDNY